MKDTLKRLQEIQVFTNIGIGEEKNYFIESMSMLLASGINVVPALESIKLETKSVKLKEAITEIQKDIDAGSNIWKALDKSNLFPAYVISLIRIGEEAGRLTENLKVIVLQREKEAIFKNRMRSAMMYPVLVLFASIVIGTGVAVFILPHLAKVFTNMRLELPLPTKILIVVGGFLGKYGIIVAPLFLTILAIITYFVFFHRKTRHTGQSLLFLFPGIRRLIRESELARFGFILGTLLEAGLPLDSALDSLQRASTFHKYKKLYIYLRDSIEVGNTFNKSFAHYPKLRKMMPQPIQQMIIYGEQSGNLSESLKKIGETFEAKTETSTKNLAVILEPILLIIVWFGVIGIALAVILPIYSLIGSIDANR